MARRRKSSGLKWGLVGGLVAGGAVIIPLVPKLRRRAMRPPSILKKDHRVVSGLIATLEMTPKINGTVRKAVFEQLHQNILVHAQAEEEVIYPALRNLLSGEQEGKVTEAYREHQIVKDLLRDMSTMDVLTDPFDVKLAQLKKNIRHHVEEEENEMFVLMMQRMPEDELQQLGRRLSQRKKDLKARLAA